MPIPSRAPSLRDDDGRVVRFVGGVGAIRRRSRGAAAEKIDEASRNGKRLDRPIVSQSPARAVRRGARTTAGPIGAEPAFFLRGRET